MASQSLAVSSVNFNGTNGSSSGPCKCCPYGFHIDTDFVRYCDALLTALYGNNRSFTNTCRSFGSLRRKFNLSLATPELFVPPATKTFLSYCDFNSKNSQNFTLNHDSCLDNEVFSLKEHSISPCSNGSNSKRNNGRNNYDSSASIETESSNTACEAESMLSDVVNKFEEVLLDSKSSSKSNLYTSMTNASVHESPPPSPAPSSCPSSSISKSVLTQIRNHLALSITRVKELEDQVTQIPYLQEKIIELQSQRNELLDKLNLLNVQKISSKNNVEFADSNSDSDFQRLSATHRDISDVSVDAIEQVHDNDTSKAFLDKLICTDFTPTQFSYIKCEAISIPKYFPESKETLTRSIGTLTSFAPSLPRKNAFVQTDIKSKDVTVRANSGCIGTSTDIVVKKVVSCQAFPEIQHAATDTIDFDNFVNASNESHKEPLHCKDSNVQSPVVPKVFFDKSVSTSDLYQSNSVLRPTSLDIDSSDHSLFMPKSTMSYFNSSPSSSSNSIRLCDKCHDMVNSITSENLCSQNISAFSFPKIIKSDSGISVERRQVDNKIVEESDNLILVYPASDLEMSSSLNTQSSDDHDIPDKCSKKTEKKAIDYTSMQPSKETKAALKVINENLLEPQKSNFLLSLNVSLIKKVWFKISSSDDSDSRVVEIYLDCFEKFSAKLIDFVVNLSDTNGNTAMHYAISCNNFDIVSVLLDSKVCDVNKYNKAGYTATMLVSLAKIENDIYRDVVTRLFHQADVNMKAKQNGQTALMLAASHGHIEICKILLDCGAEVNLQDNDGSTALMCAAEHGHPNVISILLSHPDCDPLLEDNEGSTALKIALVNGHNEVGILLYTGTRITNYYASSCYSSLSRLPNSPIYSSHLRRTGSFSYNPGHSSHNSSVLSLRTSPPRNRHYSMSTPSSPSSRS